ncbi:MAG: ISAs1 family transposase [Mailhella sp.]|nr:ISAs1 family transposase [Mailhella sp.]
MDNLRSLICIVEDIDDPRIDRTKLHRLSDILFIVICAMICGFTGWEQFELFALSRVRWLKKYISLENGVPSHDTMRRVFERLDPNQLKKALTEWVKVLDICLEGKVVAIDGKTLRSSLSKAKSLAPLHTLSAWAVENRVVLGECDVDGKNNEITKIPELLQLLEIKGAIITIDAMGCQKHIAEQIVNKNKADYVLALKKNQRQLYEEVELLFKCAEYNKDIHTAYYQTKEKNHGRIEERLCLSAEVGTWLGALGKEWTKLQTVAKIVSTREIGSEKRTEIRYYISSLPLDAQKIAQTIRNHWGIENTLHWGLDVVFHEDRCHIWKDNSPKNLATIRRIAFSLAKQRTPEGMSTRKAQLLTAMNFDEEFQFLLK